MFRADFVSDVQRDIALLESIYKDWFGDTEETDVGFDPKLLEVKKKIESLLGENPERKIVIFSSYSDTAEWVAKKLHEHGLRRTLLYTGKSSNSDRETVRANFDAAVHKNKQANNYDIIVATDALSEGFNLNRAGVVINYDIPYNPTRVVQRIGRINRINRRMFDQIFILNFFPTDVGDPITNIRTISTLKMLLINAIVGSDTRTLTPDEDLQSFFKRQYDEADPASGEVSWDNEYRNIYNSIKHDTRLLDAAMSIPERSRIVRAGQKCQIAISFAKRGHGLLFAQALEGEVTATIVSAEQVLKYFAALPEEQATAGDENLDAKFSILRDKITEPHPVPKIEGRRADALKIIEFLKQSYRQERDYLEDLYEAIKTYDDLSEGELKFIAQLKLNDGNLKGVVDQLLEAFTPHYIGIIKEKAEAVDRMDEIIMFTEDLRP
jgi:hypothetical protein